ncbi:MAG: hypothetical protein ACLQU3_24765 [Limisphaerales bacterium]
MASKQRKPGARKKGPTVGQRRARAEMRTLSAAWNDLTEEQRQAWDVEAHANRRGGQAARSRRRSGRRLFVKVNFRRLALGQDLLAWPPGSESVRPIPILRLAITNSGGRIALKLSVPTGQAEGVMVSSWHPLNAGVMVWKKFVRIGLLPPPVGGMSDITRPYVAKYGVPPVGKKVFIRIQQMNDYVGSIVQILSAIVPAGLSGDGQAKGA